MATETRQPDAYDDAIAYLTEHPEKIYSEWEWGKTLFEFCGHYGRRFCGCLTMIRNGREIAETPELTAAIRADARIPTHPRAITVESLPAFAEWQRRIDRELGRTPPDRMKR
jgi:hypothetical protein